MSWDGPAVSARSADVSTLVAEYLARTMPDLVSEVLLVNDSRILLLSEGDHWVVEWYGSEPDAAAMEITLQRISGLNLFYRGAWAIPRDEELHARVALLKGEGRIIPMVVPWLQIGGDAKDWDGTWAHTVALELRGEQGNRKLR